MSVNDARTFGMEVAELDELLRTGSVGVLALAEDENAYAAPVAYDYDGESLLVRVGAREGGAKPEHLESTRTATFVVHDAGTPSWSVLVRGPLRECEGGEAPRAARFSSHQGFDEASDGPGAVVCELELAEVTGRRVR